MLNNTINKTTVILLTALWTMHAALCSASEYVNPSVPSAFARIIYQSNAECKRQIYIVAQCHRDALSGLNGMDTVKVQAEIYRLGEWLIANKNVGFLLPEGYFQNNQSDKLPLSPNPELHATAPISDDVLIKQLSDTKRFMSADRLLSSNFNVILRQVEDRDLYYHIRSLLQTLTFDVSTKPLLEDIEYQQKKRSGTFLQNIPKIFAVETNEGRPKFQNALMTIGFAHIKDILKFLQERKIEIAAPPGCVYDPQKNFCELDTLTAQYGITVILPNTLAENKELLAATLN
jgi:hypothetical protein